MVVKYRDTHNLPLDVNNDIAYDSTMSKLPDYLHNNIREVAENEHISVNQLVTTAIAEKVSALATEKYLNAMAAKGSARVFDSVMAKVKNRPPLPGDEM